MNKKAIMTEAKKILFMVIGCICYSASLRVFLIPNHIVAGGVSGAASLIEILTGLPAGLFIFVINFPILVALSLMTELLTLFGDLSITDEPILSALYGGILQGIGIGFFIKYEMSSGGTELLGRITQHFFSYFSVPTHVAFFDATVVVLGAILL